MGSNDRTGRKRSAACGPCASGDGGGMDVSIRERKFSFASEYDISAGLERFYARKAIFALRDKIRLETGRGRLAAAIRGYISPIRMRHTFALSDGRVFEFCCEKPLRQVYRCEGHGAVYRLYAHRGLRLSIYCEDRQEERQIAAITRNRLVVGRGNEYSVRMDSDADLIVLLCMILTYNSDSQNSQDVSITRIDFGRFGLEGKAWDANWEPR